MKWNSICLAVCSSVLIGFSLLSNQANAQIEIFSTPVGMDNQLVFPHTSLPGATGIDFSLFTAISPVYPIPESHTIVFVFEWGPTATGPWTTGPDYVNSVPAAMTDLFFTGVFHGPEDAPFVALHMYAGGLMIVSGEFSHISVAVPEPTSAGLILCGVATWFALRRDKWRR